MKLIHAAHLIHAIYALLTLAASASGQEPMPTVDPPQAVITANAEPDAAGVYRYRVGSIIKLSFRESTAQHYRSRVIPSVVGGTPAFLLDNDGHGLTLASMPGEYVIILMVANSRGIHDTEARVIVEQAAQPPPVPPVDPGTPPTPPVPPQPPVPPVDPPDGPPIPGEPTFPPDRFGMALKTYRWAIAVQSENRAKEAAALAGACAAVRRGIEAGQFKSNNPITFLRNVEELTKVVEAIQKANATVMAGVDRKAWESYGQQTFAAVARLIATQQIATLADADALLSEIHTGLMEVSKR